jgi:hypothetical protein
MYQSSDEAERENKYARIFGRQVVEGRGHLEAIKGGGSDASGSTGRTS